MLTGGVDEGWRSGFEEGRPVKKLGAGSSVCEGQRRSGGCPSKGKGSLQLVLAKLGGVVLLRLCPKRRIDDEESAAVGHGGRLCSSRAATLQRPRGSIERRMR
jgi:hypothetical protein